MRIPNHVALEELAGMLAPGDSSIPYVHAQDEFMYDPVMDDWSDETEDHEEYCYDLDDPLFNKAVAFQEKEELRALLKEVQEEWCWKRHVA